eukprot:SAG31_NODE_141_length_22675_cov_48.948879_15_plen_62_part_00
MKFSIYGRLSVFCLLKFSTIKWLARIVMREIAPFNVRELATYDRDRAIAARSDVVESVMER